MYVQGHLDGIFFTPQKREDGGEYVYILHYALIGTSGEFE